MSTISEWLGDENITFGDKMIYLLYKFGIMSRAQMETVTGWDNNTINEALRAIRNKADYPESLRIHQKRLKKMEKGTDEYEKLAAQVADKKAEIDREKDKWLTIIRPDRTKESFYALGEKGIRYACEMQEEPYQKWKRASLQQVAHFMGTNEVLFRLRREGIMEEDWLSGKETQQNLYYDWERWIKKQKKRDGTLPCRPDSTLVLNSEKDYVYLIEYDTGKEADPRLKKRFKNYLKLWEGLAAVGGDRYGVVWVVKDEKRKRKIEAIAKKVLEDWTNDNGGKNVSFPSSVCFIQGDDTKFFLGELEPEPFWE